MPSKNLKPSMTDLPELLEKRNLSGKYDTLIANAKKGCYHDFKFDVVNPDCKYMCPKLQLIDELRPFPELRDVIEMVIDGIFDDGADDEDKSNLNEEFKDLPESMKKVIGLE